jgi:hypothetical protein
MLAKHKVGSSTLLTRSTLKPLRNQGLLHFLGLVGARFLTNSPMLSAEGLTEMQVESDDSVLNISVAIAVN